MTSLLTRYFNQQKDLGFTTVYRLPPEPVKSPAVLQIPLPASAIPVAPVKPAPAAAAPIPAALTAEPVSVENKKEALEKLRQEHQTCAACPLAATRKSHVFGTGNPDARLMFIGEAPGADEDERGEPFVGKAGQLLTKMVENGMGLKRADVYIANILKCRPPGNRDPKPEERSACTPALLAQIDIIRPAFICCLGRIAGRFILGLDENMTLANMRGRFFPFRGAEVLVTYHPSALLQHEEWKKPAWEDLKLIMQKMGLTQPVKNR